MFRMLDIVFKLLLLLKININASYMTGKII